MLIKAIEVEGFRDLESFQARDLDSVVRIAGPSPATTALGDALDLFFAAMGRTTLVRMLHRWRVPAPGEEPDIVGVHLPEQVTWSGSSVTARAMVRSASQRDLKVTLELAPDPPQFGALRDLAAKEPRILLAIARGGNLRVTVGALFTNTFDGLALTVHEFAVGDEAFPLSSGRPEWLTTFLRGLGTRWHRHERIENLETTLLDAALSADRHSAYVRWQQELEPQYGLVRVARGTGERPMILAGDLPLRRFGDDALRIAELAASIHLSGAELVWVEDGDPWSERCVEGDGSVLEQVFRVFPTGALAVAPKTDQRRPVGVRSVRKKS